MSRRAALILVASTAAGLYFATQLQLAYPPSVRSSWRYALTLNLVFYWLWGAAVPLVAWAARRFPLDAAGWWRNLPRHLLLGAVVTALQLFLGAFVVRALGASSAPLLKSVWTNFHSSYPTYLLILLGVHAWRAAGLRSRLAEARLDALRGQLQPHFLFNTLNSISSLMYQDPAAADAMLAGLAELLRVTLRADPRREIPLHEELALLERYLDIERIRFEERLTVIIEVADAAREARIPPLLLQPLVENAIRHAIAPRPDGGRLTLTARREARTLIVTVADDGPGIQTATPSTGVGLTNTRARLAELYGDAGRLTLTDGDGLTVTVEIPQ